MAARCWARNSVGDDWPGFDLEILRCEHVIRPALGSRKSICRRGIKSPGFEQGGTDTVRPMMNLPIIDAVPPIRRVEKVTFDQKEI